MENPRTTTTKILQVRPLIEATLKTIISTVKNLIQVQGTRLSKNSCRVLTENRRTSKQASQKFTPIEKKKLKIGVQCTSGISEMKSGERLGVQLIMGKALV